MVQQYDKVGVCSLLVAGEMVRSLRVRYRHTWYVRRVFTTGAITPYPTPTLTRAMLTPTPSRVQQYIMSTTYALLAVAAVSCLLSLGVTSKVPAAHRYEVCAVRELVTHHATHSETSSFIR